MRFDDANSAAEAIRRSQNRQREGLRPFRAEVTGITSDLVELQRTGASVDEDAGYPLLIPGAVEVGDEIVALDLGGAPVVLGRLGDIETPMIGQVFVRGASASAADDPSNTSTSVYETAIEATFADLPDGTYDVVIDYNVSESHSSSGNVHNRLTVGGVDDTAFSLSLTTAREPIGYTRAFSDVTIVGGITIAAMYKLNGGSGTISARNPSLRAWFTYKGS